MKRCPGMDPAHFKPEDIHIQHCAACGAEMEFWKDDIFQNCPVCQIRNTGARIQNTCLAWCREAARCIGNQDLEQWLQEHARQCEKPEPRKD